MAPGLDVYAVTRGEGDIRALAAAVARWERLGVRGVLFPDHLFFSVAGDRSQEIQQATDPFVLASSAAARSDRLVVGTMVANIGLQHPALVLRHFSQLATLYGGDRVIAGIGAGWNNEEFEAIGKQMPSHQARTERLRAAADLARRLFDDGVATLQSSSFSVSQLPSSPRPPSPPRLLIGGGSDATAEIGALFADILDLNGSSRRVPLNRQLPRRRDVQRRLTTTVDDLSASVEQVRKIAAAAGRPAGLPRISAFVSTVEFCAEQERAERAAAICAEVGIPAVPLSQCPYALVGTPENMIGMLTERQKRLGLSAILVPDSPGLDRLVREVLPFLA